MKRYKHIAIVLSAFERVITAGLFFFLMACQTANDTDRNIDFNKEWVKIDSRGIEPKNVFEKDFNLKVVPDKIYLLDFNPGNNITQLMLNNRVVPGMIQNNSRVFNLTEFLGDKNQLKIQLSQRDSNIEDFDIQINRVNQQYISGVEMELCEIGDSLKSLLLEVSVNNASNYEKQGNLICEISSSNDRKKVIRETPLFLSGNSEIFHRQNISIDTSNDVNDHFDVLCKIFFDGKLMDEYPIVFRENTQIIHPHEILSKTNGSKARGYNNI